MNAKLMIRCALVCVLAFVATSCLFKDHDYRDEYTSHLKILFEPQNESDWSEFLNHFFNNGKDTVAFYPSISMGPVYFFAKLDDEKVFQGGMSICRGKDADASAERKPSRFAVYDADGGNDKSRTYAVFHDTTATLMPEHFIQVYIPNTDSYCSAEFLYVQNVQAAVQAAKYGVGLAEGPFREDDYFLLTITGMLGTKVTGTVEVKLVDGTDVIKNWKEVDIESLGRIDAIDFKLTSSRADFPLYCCLDDLGLFYYEAY